MDTGRNTPQQTEAKKETYPEGSLEAKGYTIKPSPRGGRFILYRLGEKENEPIDEVKETQKWLEETSALINVPIDTVKKAKLKAKNTPKKSENNETTKTTTQTFEILTSKLNQVSPDSGVINGRAYLGFWLPAKVTEDDGVKVRKIFYLLFNDGELVPADSETLSAKNIFLHSDPV